MGGMWFDPTELGDALGETVGYKAGLALSIDEMCRHLEDSRYAETLKESEQRVVRLRSEEYEDLFYQLLHRVGHTEDRYDGDITGAKVYHKYKEKAPKELAGVSEILLKWLPLMAQKARDDGTKVMDPRPLLEECEKSFGRIGVQIALERLSAISRGLSLSPFSAIRYHEWKNPLQLAELFASTTLKPEIGSFFDQRFIDYLQVNNDQLLKMHWRRFEELAAEFFAREGLQVALGPGGNDDGVDIRVWRQGADTLESPLCLIQCKRQKDKVGKVTVKGLAADVAYENAQYGVLVTTSELAPGARATVKARGYPVQEVNRKKLAEWLDRLRTPGTGIVRFS